MSFRIAPLRRSFSSSSVAKASNKLTAETINPKIVDAEYAVRGSIVLRSMEIAKQLQDSNHSLPFKKIIPCNIGNPHALKQQPITFHREVLALVNVPHLLNDPKISSIFASDSIHRAKEYLKHLPDGTGAYSHSKGVEYLRQQVANFIEERDGYPADPESIFLTDGASQAVQSMIKALVRTPKDSLLVPIPQYPLYSAGIALNGGTMCGYYLDESKGWSTNVDNLKETLENAKREGKNPRALVIINPGNPTGQCLGEQNMKEIIEFCQKEELMILADEVYQENVYSANRKFTSFKKVLKDMGPQFNDVELISFHSTSKGFLGECGRRGGYMEVVGVADCAREQLYKLSSVNLCSNLDGQIMTALMTNPPKEGSPSYEKYVQERDGILESLKRRAKKLVEAYRKLEGVTCNETEGALYCFPQIELPVKAVEAAKKAGVAPDALYCMELLEQTGIVVVPGSGFGQKDGTWHLRSTILPSEDDIDDVIERTSTFHEEFLAKYRS